MNIFLHVHWHTGESTEKGTEGKYNGIEGKRWGETSSLHHLCYIILVSPHMVWTMEIETHLDFIVWDKETKWTENKFKRFVSHWRHPRPENNHRRTQRHRNGGYADSDGWPRFHQKQVTSQKLPRVGSKQGQQTASSILKNYGKEWFSFMTASSPRKIQLEPPKNLSGRF